VETANEVSFSLSMQSASSHYPLVATLKPNTYNPNSCLGCHLRGTRQASRAPVAGRQHPNPTQPVRLRLRRLAQVIGDVKERALPEAWGFEEGDTSILRSYLWNTYQRAALQEKVLVSVEEDLAAFNSGLVTNHL